MNEDEEKYPNRHVMGGYPRATQEVKVTIDQSSDIGPAHPAYVDLSEYKNGDTIPHEERHLLSDQVQWPADSGTTLKWDDTPGRAFCLREAEALITNDRNNAYGPPDQDFTRTAEMWKAMGYVRVAADGETVFDMTPVDVARMMIALKLSRSVWMDKGDNWIDIAGYAACGYEVGNDNDCDS